MKNIFAFFIIFLFCINADALIASSFDKSNNDGKTYLPFLENGKEWFTRTRRFSGGYIDTTYTRNFIDGDTVIGNTEYKILARQKWEPENNQQAPVFYTNIMRDDFGKLICLSYSYVHPEEVEYPIIDMTLMSNDTIFVYDRVGDEIFPGYDVLSTDSIIVNDIVRRRIVFGRKKYNETSGIWVEGIGSVNWKYMLAGYSTTDGARISELMECRLNGETIFTIDDFYTPGLAAIPATNISDEGDTAPITIEGNRLTLAPEAAEATVHNAAGQLVGHLLPGQSLTLSRGIYILRTANKTVKVAL